MKKPTKKQIGYLKGLSKKTGVPITDDFLKDFESCKLAIDKLLRIRYTMPVHAPFHNSVRPVFLEETLPCVQPSDTLTRVTT